MGAKLFYAPGRRVDAKKLRVAFRNFANALKKSLEWKLTEETNMCRFCWNVNMQRNLRVTGSDSFSLVHNASAF